MNSDHERFEELTAAEVLGGLEQPERDELDAITAEHGPDCAQCEEIRAGYAETAADLALALDPMPPRAGAVDRLLAEVTGSASTGPSATRRWRRVGLAAAAAVVLLVAGGAIGYAIRRPSGTSTSRAIGDYLNQPGARLVAFPAPNGQSLAVLFRSGQSRAWILGSGLPQPAGDHVYELWYQPAGAQNMRPGGTFGGGTVTTATTVSTPITALAISVEPHGGSPQPTTKPIYVITVHN